MYTVFAIRKRDPRVWMKFESVDDAVFNYDAFRAFYPDEPLDAFRFIVADPNRENLYTIQFSEVSQDDLLILARFENEVG